MKAPFWKRLAAALLLSAWTLPTCAAQVGAAQAGAAESKATPAGNWYAVEVVVFQRPGELDDGSGERLVQQGGLAFPEQLSGFRPAPGGFAARYRLDPHTRLCLVFPYLDQRALHQSRQPPGRDASPGAGASPGPGSAPPRIEPRLAPDPLLDYLRALGRFEATLEADSYRPLPSETFSLEREASRLSRSSRYQVLLHQRWVQPVPARDAPEPLLIQALPASDDFALQGVFEVTLGRYLHFRARLFYQEPLLGRAPLSRPQPPPGVEPEPVALYPAPADLAAAGRVELDQRRRMKSGELHYLDHPKLGVLVRIEPVMLPEALSAAAAGLKERRK